MRWVVRLLQYLGLVLVAAAILGPLIWLVLLAIRPSSLSSPLDLTFRPDWSAFRQLFGPTGVGTVALVASVLQAGIATLIAMPLAILASYGLTRFRYRGRNALGGAFLGMMLAPPMVLVIPLFVVLSRLQLAGTHWGPILAYQTFAIPFGILLLRNFFEDIPMAIEEAAMVDGASRLGILVRVFVPLVAPGLLVASLFVFCLCWDNLIFAMPLTGEASVPLTVTTLGFFTTSGISWNYIGATAIVSAIVPMFLFWVFRRHLVAGLTFGAVVG